MSRLRTIVSFFALPAEQQIRMLPEIPYDRGAPDYYSALKYNPIYLLVRGVGEEYSQPEFESDECYLARTGLPSGHTRVVLSELRCYVGLLLSYCAADDYWNQRSQDISSAILFLALILIALLVARAVWRRRSLA